MVIIGGYIIMPRGSFKLRPKISKSRRTKRDNRRKKNKRKNNKTKRRRKQYGGIMTRPINRVYIIALDYIESDGIDHNMFLEELHRINLGVLGIDNVVDYINYVTAGREQLTVWKNLHGTNLNNDQIRKYDEAIKSLIGIEGI